MKPWGKVGVAVYPGFGFYAIIDTALTGARNGGRLVLHTDPRAGFRSRRHTHVEDDVLRSSRLERVADADAGRHDDEDPPVAAARDAVGLDGDDLGPVARREAGNQRARREDREEEARRQEADRAIVLALDDGDATRRRAGAHEQGALLFLALQALREDRIAFDGRGRERLDGLRDALRDGYGLVRDDDVGHGQVGVVRAAVDRLRWGRGWGHFRSLAKKLLALAEAR